MEQTYVFKLLSGPEAEITHLTGEQEDILTRQDKQTHMDKLHQMIASILKRVGSNTNIDVKFVERMLAEDKKLILTTARQYTLGWQPKFSFNYEYLSVDGEKAKSEQHMTLTDDGKFPMRKPHYRNEAGELVEMDFEEYSEVPRTYQVVLPFSKQIVTVDRLTGIHEKAASAYKKEEQSSLTLIKVRNPRYEFISEKNEGGKATLIQLPLNKQHQLDLTALREERKLLEGNVDTEAMFEHPESEHKMRSEQTVKIDLLGVINFFFPAGAI